MLLKSKVKGRIPLLLITKVYVTLTNFFSDSVIACSVTVWDVWAEHQRAAAGTKVQNLNFQRNTGLNEALQVMHRRTQLDQTNVFRTAGFHSCHYK